MTSPNTESPRPVRSADVAASSTAVIDSKAQTMFSEVDIHIQQQSISVSASRLHQAVMAVLEEEQVASAVLSISIVDNPTIHRINREHLDHDYPTDVISFQLDFASAEDLQEDAVEGEDEEDEERLDEDQFDDSYWSDLESEEAEDEEAETDSQAGPEAEMLPASGRAAGCMIEGEVIASAETAAQMAIDAGWSTDDELILYVVHGILHICGYDDLSPAEKAVMREREIAVLKRIGLTPRYATDDLAS